MDGPGVLLGAIADDFTGATDLASALARSGQPVSLRIGVLAGPPLPGVPGRVELRGIEPLTSSMPWKRSTN